MKSVPLAVIMPPLLLEVLALGLGSAAEFFVFPPLFPISYSSSIFTSLASCLWTTSPYLQSLPPTYLEFLPIPLLSPLLSRHPGRVPTTPPVVTSTAQEPRPTEFLLFIKLLLLFLLYNRLLIHTHLISVTVWKASLAPSPFVQFQ